MYSLLRRFLFLFDPEKVHYFSMDMLKKLARIPGMKNVLSTQFVPPDEQDLYFSGIRFRNRIGLGAGFDKNAKYLDELALLGFGFVEIGTVTPLPQEGNAWPRLFRLPEDKALINRMGFNNDGVEVVAQRLSRWRKKQSEAIPGYLPLIVGGNIGKNKITPNEEAWKDYEKCFVALHPYVAYFVVNVSSPNTPGLRELQEKDALQKILTNLQSLNRRLPATAKPILLKIAPDLSKEQVDDVISLAEAIQLDGLVVANTTLDRSTLSGQSKGMADKQGAGGLSGKPLQQRSSALLQYIHQQTKGRLPVIASGGVFTGEDALEKLDSGAQMIQVWTGFIYVGPSIVKKIQRVIRSHQSKRTVKP